MEDEKKELDLDLDKIIETIKTKKLLQRYIVMITCLFLSSIVFNLLTLPANIVTGGVNGLAVILNYISGVKPSIIIFIISFILLIFSYIYLGVERTSGTVVATIVYPLFVQLTSIVHDYIPLETNDLLVISIFLGVILGVLNGFICKTGFSGGGIPAISQILHKKFKISVGKCNFFVNTLIVLFGASIFGWTMVMYSVIILYISGFTMDKVLLGVGGNKAFYIITKEEEKVRDYIVKQMKHTVTEFKVKGAFLEKRRTCFLSVIPTHEYFRVTEGLKEIDPEAFFVVCDAYQVEGGK